MLGRHATRATHTAAEDAQTTVSCREMHALYNHCTVQIHAAFAPLRTREGKTKAADWFQSTAPTAETREATKTLAGWPLAQSTLVRGIVVPSTGYQNSDQRCFPFFFTRHTHTFFA